MAESTQEVTLHRSFAYTDKDKKQHYFTRGNAATMLKVMPEEHLRSYAERGYISFNDVIPAPEITPTEVPSGTTQPPRGAAPGGLKPATVTTATRAPKES